MITTSQSLHFTLKLLLSATSATKAGPIALVLLSLGHIAPAAAQSNQTALRPNQADANHAPQANDSTLSNVGSEDALIQQMAGRAVKRTSLIGRATTQSLPKYRQASALALKPIAKSAVRRPVSNLTTPPPSVVALIKQPLEAKSTPATKQQPAVNAKRIIAQAPQTPLPPRRTVAVKPQPEAKSVTERVFQAPQSNYRVAPMRPAAPSYYAAPQQPYAQAIPAQPWMQSNLAGTQQASQPTNPVYIPQGAYPVPSPYQIAGYPAAGYPAIAANPGYGTATPTPAYNYARPASNYGNVQQRNTLPPMPALPSLYASLQNPYGNAMPRLTPPVARLRTSNNTPSVVAQQLVPPNPRYAATTQAPAPSVLPQGTSYYQPQPTAQQYAPQPYAVAVPYAQVPQYQYMPPQYYVQRPQYYAPPPQTYYVPQPQQFVPVPQQQYYAQPQPQPQQFVPVPQPAAQPLQPQIIPQLGAYPRGGYQQPAVANPLNAPLAVPVNGAGIATPSTEATALKGTRPKSPLIRSTATTEPSLTLQGVYQYQADENSARARISGIYPLSPNALFGATVDVSTGSGFTDTPNDGFNINELYFATSLPEIPNLRFAVGQLDLTSYFDRNSFAKDGATHFFNPTFQTNAALAVAGLGSRPGLLANWSLSDNLEAKAAAFSSSRGLSDFSLNAFAGELGLRYGNAIIRGTYVTGRDSGNRDSFREAFLVDRGNGQFGLLEDDRESAFGINGEFFIPKLKMGVFARYGRYNNLDAGESGDTYGAGISFLDVFSTDDRLGLAYGSALTNETLRRQSGRAKADALELFYDFRFLPNLRFGLSLQQRNDFSEIVAGVRVKTEFDITPKGRLLQ
ncbi:hypothetical protein IQ266_15520 [filamentous cyanobacterium LEGE 11480]|uniref:Porin n=1 Tax=Romeriopsis navalis LEGE 11480 TaxID=2777977 RepID=A0A928Z565_9CYAN|nr:hypothetical protein [Romeriopsis navalis]MBE9031143.1 hypothetical protein [Romeriopsis navalis LEGE 11480]